MLVVLYGCAFIAGYNENLVNMSLVAIMNDFSIDAITANWLVTGYMIVATIVVTCMAFLYRRFKLRHLFFFAAGVSLIGSFMGFFASSFLMLLVARLIQAIGTGVFIPLMMNTILVVAPKAKMSSYLSIGSCMITFGPAFAPVLCGALTTTFGWHSIFIVPFVVLLGFTVAGALKLQNLENSAAHLDGLSLVLISVAIFSLSYGLAELTVNLPIACGALVVMVASTAAFVVRQNHSSDPLLDMRPLKNKNFSPTLVLTMIAMMSTFSLSVLLPVYLEASCGLTAFAAGMLMLVPILVNAATSLLGGKIMDKSGEWPLIPFGFLVLTAGFVALVFMAPTLNLALVFAALIVLYGAVGLVMSPSQSAGLKRLPVGQNPHGVSLSSTGIQIAACIGPALYTGIMSGVQEASIAEGMTSGNALATGLSVAMMVACAVAALGLVISTIYARKVPKFSYTPVRSSEGCIAEENAAKKRTAEAHVAGQRAVEGYFNENRIAEQHS
jgi:DHA2 family lincomycin resistance protein-like MFS transporter